MSEADNADHRIPVKKTTWERASNLKKAGQTFDELFNELMDTSEKYHILVTELTL